MMPVNANTSNLFSRMCFKKSEVTSAESIETKMVVIKHLTHFCYPIRLVLHQHLNSLVAYPGIQPENSSDTRRQYQYLPSVTKTTYCDTPRWQNVSSLDVLRDIHGFQAVHFSHSITFIL